MKASLIALPLVAATALVLGGCGNQVRYGDATAVETVTTEFGSTDLQMIAEKMVDDLLATPVMAEIAPPGTRPVLFVDRIKNKTLEHIDTESITDTISTKLLNSGRFRFVDRTRVEAITRELDYQAVSGMVDEAKSVQMGRQFGAQYMLYGNLSSIEKQANGTRDAYYKFTMKLTNLESGLVEFQSEKEIRKTRKRGLIGR